MNVLVGRSSAGLRKERLETPFLIWLVRQTCCFCSCRYVTSKHGATSNPEALMAHIVLENTSIKNNQEYTASFDRQQMKKKRFNVSKSNKTMPN